jgi:hypothetical protein
VRYYQLALTFPYPVARVLGRVQSMERRVRSGSGTTSGFARVRALTCPRSPPVLMGATMSYKAKASPSELRECRDRDSAAAVACSLLAAARSSCSRPVQMVPPIRF